MMNRTTFEERNRFQVQKNPNMAATSYAPISGKGKNPYFFNMITKANNDNQSHLKRNTTVGTISSIKSYHKQSKNLLNHSMSNSSNHATKTVRLRGDKKGTGIVLGSSCSMINSQSNISQSQPGSQKPLSSFKVKDGKLLIQQNLKSKKAAGGFLDSSTNF